MCQLFKVSQLLQPFDRLCESNFWLVKEVPRLLHPLVLYDASRFTLCYTRSAGWSIEVDTVSTDLQILEMVMHLVKVIPALWLDSLYIAFTDYEIVKGANF